MPIIDRRQGQRHKLSGSRAKFINRYKRYLRGHIDKHIKQTNIKDIGKGVKIKTDNIKSAIPVYNNKESRYKNVHPGNKQYQKGDIIRIPKQNSVSTGGKGETTDSDEFIEFTLSKDEFLDLLFDNLRLPNFLKKSDKYMTKIYRIIGGYTKVGVPAKLAFKKTFENAVKRKLALKNSYIGKRFLDDIDLRYRDSIEEKKPISHAIMFCAMDLSGSMTDNRRLIAKKFFLLLYLFLQKNYESVEIRFIAHTTDAFEVSESIFFNSTMTGGTVLSSPISLINKIIDTEYDIDTVNIYIAHASDGENWSSDYPVLKNELESILPKIQYFTYIEVDQQYKEWGATKFYQENFDSEKIGCAVIDYEADVYQALVKLFSDGGK